MSSTRYFITTKTTCPDCGGKGYVMPGANNVGAVCPNFKFREKGTCDNGEIIGEIEVEAPGPANDGKCHFVEVWRDDSDES